MCCRSSQGVPADELFSHVDGKADVKAKDMRIRRRLERIEGLAEQKEITACLSNTSITDIFYIVRKHAGQDKARAFIFDILDTFSLADIDEESFREVLGSDMSDFEDAVQ